MERVLETRPGRSEFKAEKNYRSRGSDPRQQIPGPLASAHSTFSRRAAETAGASARRALPSGACPGRNELRRNQKIYQSHGSDPQQHVPGPTAPRLREKCHVDGSGGADPCRVRRPAMGEGQIDQPWRMFFGRRWRTWPVQRGRSRIAGVSDTCQGVDVYRCGRRWCR